MRCKVEDSTGDEFVKGVWADVVTAVHTDTVNTINLLVLSAFEISE